MGGLNLVFRVDFGRLDDGAPTKPLCVDELLKVRRASCCNLISHGQYLACDGRIREDIVNGIVKLLPTAEVGFLGIKRNEETLQPYTYANRLPDDLTNRQVFIIDPMLATGGTLIDSIDYVFQRGATDVTAICLLGAPEGLAAVEAHVHGKDVKIVLGALDEKLNEHGYIVPGLGDAGDRLYGLAD